MKRVGLILVLMMTLVFTGCNLQGDSVDDAEKKVEEKKPTIILKEKEVLEEPIIYGLGERAVVRDDYAVTILSVKETDYRLPWSPEQENVIVEMIFENLSMDENHETFHSEWGRVTGFDLRMDSGTHYPPTVFSDAYTDGFTPAGTKSFHQFIFESPEHPNVANFRFSDYRGEDPIFEIQRGKRIEADLTGELPEPEIVYGLGEKIVLAKGMKEYTLTVNSVKKVDFDGQNPYFISEAEYEVELEFSNVDIQTLLYSRDFQISLIDGHGNTAYLNNEKYPEENADGVTISMIFSANTDTDKVMLYYTDSFIKKNKAFYILIDDIE